MIRLPEALHAWGTPVFRETLKGEIERLAPAQLPLQQGLSRTSYATERPHTVVVLGFSADAHALRARVGIFYAGIVVGCSCADDPTPVTEEEEYCELQVVIDRATALATFSPVAATPE